MRERDLAGGEFREMCPHDTVVYFSTQAEPLSLCGPQGFPLPCNGWKMRTHVEPAQTHSCCAEFFVEMTKVTLRRVNLAPELPKVFRFGENFALFIPKRAVLTHRGSFSKRM